MTKEEEKSSSTEDAIYDIIDSYVEIEYDEDYNQIIGKFDAALEIYKEIVKPLEDKLEKEPRYFELEWQQQKPRIKALFGHDNAGMIEQYVNGLLAIAEDKIRTTRQELVTQVNELKEENRKLTSLGLDYANQIYALKAKIAELEEQQPARKLINEWIQTCKALLPITHEGTKAKASLEYKIQTLEDLLKHL